MGNPNNVNDRQVQSADASRNWRTVEGKEGIVYREHATRKNGKRTDRFIAIRYRAGQGKRVVETLGWASDGWTVDKAVSLLREIKENIRLGLRPQSLKEKRTMSEAARVEAERTERHAQLRQITFGELANLYRGWAKLHRASAGQVSQLLDMHILPEIGKRVASEITPIDVELLRQTISVKRPQTGHGKNNPAARLSPQTVLHALKVVREVYNYALETPAPCESGVMLYTGANPAILSRRGRGVRLPKTDARRLRVLNDAEITVLLGYTGTHAAQVAELHDMLLLSLDTGLRAGELVNLRLESVDVVNGTLRILRGADSDRSTKGGEARIVHVGRLHSQTLPMLRCRVQRSLGPWLFPGPDGVMRDSNGLNRAMRRITETLGLNENVTDQRNRVVWHTLRHTYATRMLESGVDIYTLKELMGHASVTTTEGYLHIIDRAKRERSLARLALMRDDRDRL